MTNIHINKETLILCPECGLRVATANKDILKSDKVSVSDFDWNISKPEVEDTTKCPLCDTNYLFIHPQDKKLYIFTNLGWK